MQEFQSRVNFEKLVQNLADMYHDDTFDVVLIELVANALDAKASEISIGWDSKGNILTVKDNGKGMDSDAFAQYHDFAAELKSRGGGIGFAGVGAKISFNIADRVVTETQCDGAVNASDWRWHDDGSLLWNLVESVKLKDEGTWVEVHFRRGQVRPDIDSNCLESIVRRHYLPLFISEFSRAYSAIGLYSTKPRFKINGTWIAQKELIATASLSHCKNILLRSGGKEFGWGAIGVSERDCPIDENTYGLLLCTHGKVIKSELFGQSTGVLGTRLFGIFEIPGLIEFLTTNKSELKGGPGQRRKLDQMLYPVREELRAYLAEHGVAVVGQKRNQLSAKLERELSKLVGRLPELQDFDGLLRKSRALRKGSDGNTLASETGNQSEDTGTNEQDNSVEQGTRNGSSPLQPNREGTTQAKRRRSRKNQGPRVAFEDHPDRNETAWLDANTVVINSGHRAYRNRTTHDQAKLTYCMFAIGVALDKAELVQAENSGRYVDAFISAWGES